MNLTVSARVNERKQEMDTDAPAAPCGFKSGGALNDDAIAGLVKRQARIAALPFASERSFRVAALPLRAQPVAVVSVQLAFVIVCASKLRTVKQTNEKLRATPSFGRWRKQ